MLFSTPILDMAIVSNNHERGQEPGGYSLISAVYVFAAPKGMVYGPFWWFGIGYGFQGTYGSVHVQMYLSFSVLNE